MAGEVGLTWGLPEFGAALRATTGTPEERVVAALSGHVRPVLRLPWPDPPEMGPYLPALEALVRAGKVRDLSSKGCRCFLLRGSA